VIIIIGLLAAIAVPRVAGGIAHHRAEAAANRIVRDLEFARSRARTSSAEQTVAFDVAADSYALTDVQDIDRSHLAYAVWLSKEPYLATIVSAEFGGDSEIIFDGYGKADSGGTVVVKSGGYLKTITVDPDTGEASVE